MVRKWAPVLLDEAHKGGTCHRTMPDGGVD